MKDIDFDELDKAVNSLMNQTAKPEPAKEESTPAELQPAAELPAPAEATAPEQTAPEPETEQAAEPTPEKPAEPAPAAPARKRSGRFMDMVHPSADMKNATPARPVSRKGVTIAPATSATTAEPQPESVASPVEPPTVEEQPSTPDVDASMPDPIDMHNAANANDTPDKESVEPTPEKAETPVEQALGENGDEAPQGESPFIADAKVEKRPLGGDNTEQSGGEEPEAIAKPEELDRPTTEPTPAELGADVVAVEASEPKDFAKAAEEAKSSPEPMSEPETEAKDANSAIDGGSIHQQYKEQPSSSDTRHAAIYDAETYPAAGGKMAKKKSGWTWILWIFVLLSLGAGGAVVLYMMNII